MRSETGMTLIEAIVALVVVAVAAAGMAQLFAQATRGSSDPVVRKQLIAVAESMMEEILLKPYAPTSGGVASGCARDSFVGISDYNGYPPNGRVCDVEGVPVAALEGYTLAVRVVTDATTLSGVAEARRITVTVSRGNEAFELLGWRTHYAGP